MKTNLILTVEIPLTGDGLQALKHIKQIVNGLPEAVVVKEQDKDPGADTDKEQSLIATPDQPEGSPAPPQETDPEPPTPGESQAAVEDQAAEKEMRDKVRTLLSAKSKTHQKEIRAEMVRIKAKNISSIPVNLLPSMVVFLTNLK